MIKTILFDFGDVFINLDKEGTNRKLKEMNIEDLPESILAKNRDYEQGFVTSDEISEHYSTHFPNLGKEDFLDSWNSMILEFPEYRFRFIQKLAREKDYQLILLSNTNENHISYIENNVPFFKEFKECFEAFYLSHEMGLRKPHPEIFEYILKQHKLKAENCLFIDDTLENTEAAKKLGFHVWNIEPTREDVIDLFTTKKELF